jgi:hypothetical protein
MFELFSDIYFVVYKLYYISQNDNLGIRVSLKNWDRGSSRLSSFVYHDIVLYYDKYNSHTLFINCYATLDFLPTWHA